MSPLNVTDDLSGIGSVDLVLVGVKAWQVPAVAPALGPLIGDHTAILPLQNGVATPVHRFIYNALLPMETLARG